MLVAKRKMSKKGAFQTIANGMIAFIGFVLISILTILLVQITANTSIVTSSSNATAAMGYLMQAAALPPQFASLIVIVVIIVGILGMLAFVGYGVYQQMKQ